MPLLKEHGMMFLSDIKTLIKITNFFYLMKTEKLVVLVLSLTINSFNIYCVFYQ